MTKQIMQDFQIVNEAELFCSDMEFKVSDDSISKRYIGDRSKNSEDVQKCCSERVQELIKIFRAKFDEIQKRVNTDNSALNERQAKKIVAHTVYFATYFHPE